MSTDCTTTGRGKVRLVLRHGKEPDIPDIWKELDFGKSLKNYQMEKGKSVLWKNFNSFYLLKNLLKNNYSFPRKKAAPYLINCKPNNVF